VRQLQFAVTTGFSRRSRVSRPRESEERPRGGQIVPLSPVPLRFYLLKSDIRFFFNYFQNYFDPRKTAQRSEILRPTPLLFVEELTT